MNFDFVAFDHNRCCGQPHRDRLKAHGEQDRAIRYVTIPISDSTTFNSRANNRGATQSPPLNTFPVFFLRGKEQGWEEVRMEEKVQIGNK